MWSKLTIIFLNKRIKVFKSEKINSLKKKKEKKSGPLTCCHVDYCPTAKTVAFFFFFFFCPFSFIIWRGQVLRMFIYYSRSCLNTARLLNSLSLSFSVQGVPGRPMADLNLTQNGTCSSPSPTPAASDDHGRSALIFLGTGCSSAVPNAMCLIQPSDPPCAVCSQSLSVPPEKNPNYRLLADSSSSEKLRSAAMFGFRENLEVGKEFQIWILRFEAFWFYFIFRCNTSLLIDYCRSDGNHSYVLIDVGKTFREQVLRWFPLYKIPRVDSVSLLFYILCSYNYMFWFSLTYICTLTDWNRNMFVYFN